MSPSPSLRLSVLFALLFTALPFSALLLSTCAGEGPKSEGSASRASRLTVAVSIPPQAWLVERLAGDLVELQVLMPSGTSPETFEPSPRQVVALDRARLFLAVGHPDFPFERRLLDRLLDHRDDLTVLSMTEGLGSLVLAGHDHPHSAGAGSSTGTSTGAGASDIDPHVWVAPETMAALAETVAQALATLDPKNAASYRWGLETLRIDIAKLDRELESVFAGVARRRFWVYHPAWGYLARQYGLEQVAMESEGKELSAARLVALIDRARKESVTVVFVQRGFSDRAARALATEAGARVEVLDPLAHDWPSNLREVASRLQAAMEAASASRARLR